MAKAKTGTVFFCKECGYESGKWMGQCPACKEWNTFVEEPVVSERRSQGAERVRVPGRGTAPVHISDISLEEQDRTATGFGELDRVLGSGIVRGSLVLVGGDPGIENPPFCSRFAGICPWLEKRSFIFPGRSP